MIDPMRAAVNFRDSVTSFAIKQGALNFITRHSLLEGVLDPNHRKGGAFECFTNLVHAMSFDRKQDEYGAGAHVYSRRMEDLVLYTDHMDAIKVVAMLWEIKRASTLPIAEVAALCNSLIAQRKIDGAMEKFDLRERWLQEMTAAVYPARSDDPEELPDGLMESITIDSHATADVGVW